MLDILPRRKSMIAEDVMRRLQVLPCLCLKERWLKTFKAPLQPLPVGRPFQCFGIDVLQLPLTAPGNRYVVVFLDYFTKLAEAFAVPNQKAETVARLLVEQVVCQHGIPEELLSDRGANFLSSLIQNVCKILGMKKINISGYHPQTDGLVEKFNSTLTAMIAKSCDVRDREWDDQLPFLLFAYKVSVQESTRDFPFYLMHGRDPHISTETVLTSSRSPYAVDTDDYEVDLCSNLSTTWELAKTNIGKAQVAQKSYYGRFSKAVDVKPGDRVMVYMPAE